MTNTTLCFLPSPSYTASPAPTAALFRREVAVAGASQAGACFALDAPHGEILAQAQEEERRQEAYAPGERLSERGGCKRSPSSYLQCRGRCAHWQAGPEAEGSQSTHDNALDVLAHHSKPDQERRRCLRTGLQASRRMTGRSHLNCTGQLTGDNGL